MLESDELHMEDLGASRLTSHGHDGSRIGGKRILESPKLHGHDENSNQAIASKVSRCE